MKLPILIVQQLSPIALELQPNRPDQLRYQCLKITFENDKLLKIQQKDFPNLYNNSVPKTKAKNTVQTFKANWFAENKNSILNFIYKLTEQFSTNNKYRI